MTFKEQRNEAVATVDVIRGRYICAHVVFSGRNSHRQTKGAGGGAGGSGL